MALSILHFCVLAFCLLLASAASSTVISDGVFDSHGPTSRSLLQALKSCPVDFESANYTIVTSQCKGPKYDPTLCCNALKVFACPYADELNDLTNDCASTMFSYLNLYGKYPPGIFASECREDKQGLLCPAAPPESQGSSASRARGPIVSGYLLLLTFPFLFVPFQLF